MNSMVAGTDLGDRESLTTVLSPIADRFTSAMNEEGYAYFARKVPTLITETACDRCGR